MWKDHIEAIIITMDNTVQTYLTSSVFVVMVQKANTTTRTRSHQAEGATSDLVMVRSPWDRQPPIWKQRDCWKFPIKSRTTGNKQKWLIYNDEYNWWIYVGKDNYIGRWNSTCSAELLVCSPSKETKKYAHKTFLPRIATEPYWGFLTLSSSPNLPGLVFSWGKITFS